MFDKIAVRFVEMQVFHIIKTKGPSIPKFSSINLSR